MRAAGGAAGGGGGLYVGGGGVVVGAERLFCFYVFFSSLSLFLSVSHFFFDFLLMLSIYFADCGAAL